MNHQRIGILEYLFKHIRTRDFMQIIEQLNQFLMLELHTKDVVDAILFYVYNNGNTDDPQKLVEQLQHSPNQYQENIMNFAQYLEQLGLEKGKKEGLQLGEQKVQEVTLTIAKNMLMKGADIDFIKSTTDLSESEIQSLIN